MLREVRVFEKLHHRNVIAYKHSWIEETALTQMGPSVPCLYILMEYADMGNLEDYIERRTAVKNSGALVKIGRNLNQIQQEEEQLELLELFRDVCSGLIHLHQHDIIHRDLKPSNLLLKKDVRTGRVTLVLSDFGECEDMRDLADRERSGFTGTPEYMAPELLILDSQGRYFDSFTTKSDIWSLGMVLYYMNYGKLPFRGSTVDEIEREIVAGEFAQPIGEKGLIEYKPNVVKDLIGMMLQADPGTRPTAEEVLAYLDSRWEDGQEIQEPKPEKNYAVSIIRFGIDLLPFWAMHLMCYPSAFRLVPFLLSVVCHFLSRQFGHPLIMRGSIVVLILIFYQFDWLCSA